MNIIINNLVSEVKV